MLQRLKGAIDSRIAEEQARQKSALGTPSRSSSNARRSPRNDSRKRQDKPGADTQSIQGPGPDPSDFDGDTVIDSADIQSRSATPQEDMTKPKESDDGGTAEKEAGDTQLDKTGEAQGRQSIELPTDVRVKLRKLEKLESRYQDLLRSYRVAHARVMTIENFETSLRENTPLTSISEPGALLEYLNQLNTKSDMVMQELKRVSGERDEYKSGLELAEAALKKAQDETESSRNDNSAKSSNVDSASKIAENEEFFSYDSELPRLESELKAKDEEVDALQQEVKTLKVDLAVTRESTEGMAKSLETATKELTNLRDLEKNSEGLKTQSKMLEDTKRELGTKLEAAQTELQILKARETDNEESSRVISSLQTQLQSAREDLESSKTSITEHERRAETLKKLVVTLRGQISDLESSKSQSKAEDVSKPKPVNDSTQIEAVQPQMMEASTTSSGNVPDKKNKKKKKKGGKGATVHDEDQKITPTVGVADTKNTDHSVDNTAIRQELDEKSTQIEKLNAKLRDQEGLKEEIETLRDDLVNVGQELVEAKDNVKSSHLERTVLENRVRSLEDQIRVLEKGALEDENTSKTAGENQATELEGLKAKTTSLERELVVAQQLATTRYKDLSDMRQVLQQAQPELISLRAEAADLRTAKADLDRKTANSKKMEAEQENLHLEITSLKKQISDHEIEIKTLKEKVKQEMDQRTTAEELHKTSESERQKAQSEKKLLSESAERTMSELRSIQDAANTYRNRIRELEQQSAKLNREAENYKEEIELKAAQHASAQNLMTSMRGQTTEMSVRMKEARERGESLEEELADAHRLLSERTREGETMRRLLADVESRADVRVREMKDRMETALEERDRAEEDASTMGRRRSRELEELKSKVRDAERSLKRALDDKEDLERAQKEWRRKREELESLTEHSSQEMNEVRQAMNELRDALDESEKQVQSLEQQRSELRNATQDMQGRLEKLYKTNKNLNEEVKILNSTGKTKPSESDLRSPRSSIDSSTSRIGLGISNGFKGRGSSIDAQSGAVSGPVDYVYLKTVLLQFLEQKDKKHQLQLVPVLGMLLHFDRKDEEKWTTAITTK